MREDKELHEMEATTPAADNITALLDAWSQGEADALDSLMDVVQQELRTIAGRFFQPECPCLLSQLRPCMQCNSLVDAVMRLCYAPAS